MRLYEVYINVSFLRDYLEWGLGSFMNLKLPSDFFILSLHLTEGRTQWLALVQSHGA